MQPLTDRELAACAAAVIRLFQKWQLPDEEACRILGGVSGADYAAWKEGRAPELNGDLPQRLSLLMGIHADLRLMFVTPERGYAWVKKPNAAFGGHAPSAVMAEGMTGLERVRAYLWAQREV